MQEKIERIDQTFTVDFSNVKRVVEELMSFDVFFLNPKHKPIYYIKFTPSETILCVYACALQFSMKLTIQTH